MLRFQGPHDHSATGRLPEESLKGSHVGGPGCCFSRVVVEVNQTMKKKTNTSFVAYFILFIFVIQFVPALFAIIAGIGGSFGNADGSLILFVILTIISFIFSIRAFSSFDRMPGHKGVAGLIFGMVSMLIGDAVLLFQPVLDAWYYGAAFIIIASVLITLINVIRAFNVLTTRKLPQFATHKGGDDRA